MENNYVIVMAGGIGSRLWPFSRQNYPKQFHDLLGTGKSLLQETVERFDSICPKENIYIVTHEIYRDLVKEQLPFLDNNQILGEPLKRNTAPCVAYATYKILQKDSKANFVISPADHVVLKPDIYRDKIQKALDFIINKEAIVTLGVSPTRPDTGYGYVNFEKTEQEVALVKEFKEKPDLETAQKYIDSGSYVWNAGIFIATANTFQRNFMLHLPKIADDFQSIQTTFYTDKESDTIKDTYQNCEDISIDYGIMEKAAKNGEVYVIPGNFGWSDLGTWKSLHENVVPSLDGNVLSGNHLLYDVKNSLIKTPKGKLVVVQGLENYIVAEYENVLMICSKEQEQRVKEFVKDAQNKGKDFI